MQPRTHEALDEGLCGHIVRLRQGSAQVEFTASAQMAADRHGLVHGGFIFGLADHAAMLAVNDPNVVLGSASVKFSRPVSVGEAVRATATLRPPEGKKRIVEVEVHRGQELVMTGEFVCFCPPRHVLAPPEDSA